MPEQNLSQHDPLLKVQVQIRLSRWRKIQEIARTEQRDPRAQAGILLERTADELYPAVAA